MSLRLREALDDLQREVADLRLVSPAAVRARGDALRRRSTAGVAISTTLAVAAVGATTLAVLRPPGSTPVAPASGPPTCATAAWEDEAAIAVSTRVRVYMKLEATPEQIGHVRQALAELNLPALFRDHDQAYEEFKQLYACEPELIRLTAAENLPESFEVTLHDLAELPEFRDQLTQLPGVEIVFQMPQ